jgi:hypothetical protein
LKVEQIVIEWSESHHANDDEAFIRSHLDAGRDEGPLIVIPYSSKGPSRGPKQAAQIFENVDRYISHLQHHADELNDERWVGLVRGVSRDQKEGVLAVLYGIAQIVAPPPRSRHSPGRSKSSEKVADYQVLVGPFKSENVITVTHSGDGLAELLTRFPAITRLSDLEPGHR